MAAMLLLAFPFLAADFDFAFLPFPADFLPGCDFAMDFFCAATTGNEAVK